jgi:O-antigen ligase
VGFPATTRSGATGAGPSPGALLLGGISHAALAVAILALFLEDSKRLSAGATTLWLGLELLGRRDAMPWSWGLLAVLLLNLRGVILQEGPTPVSHMDFVLMISGFLVGFGRSRQRWQWSAAVVAAACAAGVLLQADIIRDYAWWGIEYKTALLTKNQTALLGGMGTLAALLALVLERSRRLWVPALLTILALANLLLAKASLSRAALALVPLSLALALLLCTPQLRPTRLAGRWRALPPRRRWPLIGLLAVVLLALGAGLVALIQHPELLTAVYGKDNLANDEGRLRVWSCYLGLPFLGENRFIYGVGYANSWMKWCSPDVIGRNLYHAHNLFLQIWGDAGVVPALFILACFGLIGARMLRNCASSRCASSRWLLRPAKRMDWAMPLMTTATAIYLVAFNMVELGLLKVPVLTALFGFMVSSVHYHEPTSERQLTPTTAAADQRDDAAQQRGSDNETRLHRAR